jgi:hypothetical protein
MRTPSSTRNATDSSLRKQHMVGQCECKHPCKGEPKRLRTAESQPSANDRPKPARLKRYQEVVTIAALSPILRAHRVGAYSRRALSQHTVSCTSVANGTILFSLNDSLVALTFIFRLFQGNCLFLTHHLPVLFATLPVHLEVRFVRPSSLR